MMWQHVPSGKIMAGWSSEQGLTSRGLGQTPQALDKVVTDLTKPEDWIYKTTLMYTKEQVQLLQPYGAVVHPPLPDNVYKAVQINFLFASDMAHYTEDGHVYVAHHIRNELAAQNFRKHHINTIQPWAEYDHCESWFQTGITSLDHDVGLVMNEFKKGSDKNPGKFALETRSPDTWIKIVNPQDQPAHLRIEYMVTRPDCMYPVMRLSIVGSGESDSVTVTCEDLPYLDGSCQKHSFLLENLGFPVFRDLPYACHTC